MNNLTKKFLSTLLITITITSVAIPVTQAQQNTRSTNSQSKKKPQKSTSILAAILRMLKSPENRLITRGDEVCPISPGNLGEQLIWSDRPLFIWQGKIPPSTVNLYSSSANYNYERDEELVWSQAIAANSVSIAYNGEPLNPGFIYDWEFISADRTYRSTFVMMSEEERQAIERDMIVMEDRLIAEGKDEEEIAIALADYLAQKQLWSDVFQQLYTIENPSPDLISKTEDIEQYLCESSN
ncbi:MAG: hypothetical protein AB4368_16105 [Xenococcaceae cyanobacterium]